MASLSHDRNGTKRIQFIGGAGDRRTIRLGKVPTKVADTWNRRVAPRSPRRIPRETFQGGACGRKDS